MVQFTEHTKNTLHPDGSTFIGLATSASGVKPCFNMERKIDSCVIGAKFGRLTVIKEVGRKGSNRYFLCVCDCGVTKEVRGYHLTSDKIRSCGCLVSDTSFRHGDYGTPIYNAWLNMKARCNGNAEKNKRNYVAKGITVCEEWEYDYPAFKEWSLNNGYKEGLTLDRYPDKNGNYEPANCRWATYKQQNNNFNANRIITFNGKTKNLIEWSEELGMRYNTLCTRLHYGWSEEKTLSTPIKQKQCKHPVL
jgi:hypothetical protein